MSAAAETVTMPVPIPSGASVELLRRTGLEPGSLGPNATPGRALADAFRDSLDALRDASSQTETKTASGQGETITAPAQGATKTAPIQTTTTAPPQDAGPSDRILSSFMTNKGDPPAGGVHLRLRAEEILTAHGPDLGAALRAQTFERTLALGVQAARRAPASLEEAAHTLTQGGGGG
ncbi:MAG: hypothetical protein MPJ52_05700 [Alphaproteobacteria bacterium]|nr:hypothetical protein [Alphaproteobacteria bacterium]